MTREEIIALFPITGEVTQEILATADRNNIFCCVGTMTLAAALRAKGLELCNDFSHPFRHSFLNYSSIPEFPHVHWGAKSGHVQLGLDDSLIVHADYNLMCIEHPCTVKFELYDVL